MPRSVLRGKRVLGGGTGAGLVWKTSGRHPRGRGGSEAEKRLSGRGDPGPRTKALKIEASGKPSSNGHLLCDRGCVSELWASIS